MFGCKEVRLRDSASNAIQIFHQSMQQLEFVCWYILSPIEADRHSLSTSEKRVTMQKYLPNGCKSVPVPHRKHMLPPGPNSLPTLPSHSIISPRNLFPPSTSLVENLTTTQPLTRAAVHNTPSARSRARRPSRHCSSVSFADLQSPGQKRSDEDGGATTEGYKSLGAPMRGRARNSARKNSPKEANCGPKRIRVPNRL